MGVWGVLVSILRAIEGRVWIVLVEGRREEGNCWVGGEVLLGLAHKIIAQGGDGEPWAEGDSMWILLTF
jgi:hypothetical protein